VSRIPLIALPARSEFRESGESVAPENLGSTPRRADANRNAEFLQAELDARCLEKEWGQFAYPHISAFLADPCPAFDIITHDCDGQQRPDLSRTKYDTTHPSCPKDSDGKPTKYRARKGVGVVIYGPLPDSFSTFAAARDKWIAEGEHKAQALVGLGLAVIGIGGVWNWRLSGERGLHPDLASHIRAGDVVNLAIDGDWQTNKGVHRGAYELMQAIRDVGATPRILVLPTSLGMPQLGIDDLIAMWRRTGLGVSASFATLQRLDAIPSPFVVDLKKPLDTAENFLAARYEHEDGCTLVHWQNGFYRWNGRGWETRSDALELLRQELYNFVRDNGGTPKRANIAELVDALRSAAQLRVLAVPCWREPPDARVGEVLAVANGLLDVGSRELLPPTPRYFNLNWSDVAYDPEAGCPRFAHFLEQVYPNDHEAQQCLQEFMGYCLTDDTSQQKAIALIGAKRSGKGTIARVVQDLVGRSSCCAPTLQSMGETFGLQTWIGKKVAIVADARASARNNSQAMAERILTLTGEDTQYVNRKNLTAWEGRLRVRLWLMSNMLPATQDKGGALASRFLVLNHCQSFSGKEDTKLEEALVSEYSGIFNLALNGLDRLRKRGHFVQPASGQERIADWERMNSPMLAFTQEHCDLGADLFVPKNALRNAYSQWCAENNMPISSEAHFTEELRAALEQRMKTGQRTINGKVGQRVFVGIALRGDGRRL